MTQERLFQKNLSKLNKKLCFCSPTFVEIVFLCTGKIGLKIAFLRIARALLLDDRRLTFRVAVIKHRLAAHRRRLLLLADTIQELVFGRRAGRVDRGRPVAEVGRRLSEPPHGRCVKIPAQAEALGERRRQMWRLLELVARQEGARGAVLQPGRVLRSPPAAAALRGEGQTSVCVHDAAAQDGGGSGDGSGGNDRALRAKGTE